MPLATILIEFKAALTQCEALVVNAHKTDSATGQPFLTPTDKEQVTTAAFLNMFIAWENFLESTISDLMMGQATIGGKAPTKFASPPTRAGAQAMVIGTRPHFDYANHDNVRKFVSLYFNNGYP